ncbi:MAG TPA: hypothetical protein VGM27_06255 [Acidobacteriaceae bacterium]|jgi:hypothetical protein
MSPVAALCSHPLTSVSLFLQGNPQFDPARIGSHHGLFFAPFIMFFVFLGSIVVIVPYWFIFKKAGFSPWLAILMFVPLVNIVLLYAIAFSQWRVAPVPQYPVPPAGVYPPAGGVYPPSA